MFEITTDTDGRFTVIDGANDSCFDTAAEAVECSALLRDGATPIDAYNKSYRDTVDVDVPTFTETLATITDVAEDVAEIRRDMDAVSHDVGNNGEAIDAIRSTVDEVERSAERCERMLEEVIDAISSRTIAGRIRAARWFVFRLTARIRRSLAAVRKSIHFYRCRYSEDDYVALIPSMEFRSSRLRVLCHSQKFPRARAYGFKLWSVGCDGWRHSYIWRFIVSVKWDEAAADRAAAAAQAYADADRYDDDDDDDDDDQD